MLPRKNTSETLRMGAGGGVCIVGSGSAHGRNWMRCRSRERVKETGLRRHQQGLNVRTRHV